MAWSEWKLNRGRMLRKGQQVRYAGSTWRVVRVSRAGAWIVPVGKTKVKIGDREFKARSRREVGISARAEVEFREVVKKGV